MNTPVALIIFNRPDTTARVLTEVARAKPARLFVIADGPRPDRPGEAERCAATRALVERVDWDCQVLKNYSDVNLGCGRRPATGISWVFEHVAEAIILEDDCVPHPTFFKFCEELLEKYRDDERVMHVAGHNFQFDRAYSPYSYFFSRHNLAWGWATWRRAWKHHDLEVRLWPQLRDGSWLREIVGDQRAAEFWKSIFDDAYARRGDVDYWDYQWTFACWAQEGLSILPAVNLITNIGFGPDSTHFQSGRSPMAFRPSEEITFPLRHPPCPTRNYEADRAFIERVVLPSLLQRPRLYWRLRNRVAGMLPDPLRRALVSIRDSVHSVSRYIVRYIVRFTGPDLPSISGPGKIERS